MCSCQGQGQLGMADRGPEHLIPGWRLWWAMQGRDPHTVRPRRPARSVPARIALGLVATGEVELLQKWGGVDKLQQTEAQNFRGAM